MQYVLVEIGGMIFVGIMYFLLSVFFSSTITFIDRKLTPFRFRNPFLTLFRVIVVISLIQVMVVFVRRIVKSVPYPLDKVAGYEHSKMADINGGVVIAYAIFIAQTPLTDDLKSILKWIWS